MYFNLNTGRDYKSITTASSLLSHCKAFFIFTNNGQVKDTGFNMWYRKGKNSRMTDSKRFGQKFILSKLRILFCESIRLYNIFI
ncbi:MAG TPA: hypothetical protein DCL86_08960 [Bacteroidales bacterium]|nr:hypothetical protein [Bacteroidales bacterium]